MSVFFRNAELSVPTQILYTVHFADKRTSGTTFCIETVYKSAWFVKTYVVNLFGFGSRYLPDYVR